jgi:glutaredoxin 1
MNTKGNKQFTIYGRLTCPFCIKAIEVCKEKNLSYTFFDILESDENNQSLEKLSKANNHYTVPLILVDSNFLGGCDSLLLYLGEDNNGDSFKGCNINDKNCKL